MIRPKLLLQTPGLHPLIDKRADQLRERIAHLLVFGLDTLGAILRQVSPVEGPRRALSPRYARQRMLKKRWMAVRPSERRA
jgi:hypothetical protein